MQFHKSTGWSKMYRRTPSIVGKFTELDKALNQLPVAASETDTIAECVKVVVSSVADAKSVYAHIYGLPKTATRFLMVDRPNTKYNFQRMGPATIVVLKIKNPEYTPAYSFSK